MENTENNMEFKNDGLPSEITNEQLAQMTDEQIEEMATTYSEGNDGLKSLLIYCAKNRISTFASCGGHPDNPEEDDPYIGFSLNMDSKSLLSKLFTREVGKHMQFLFHKSGGHVKLSIHVEDGSRAASDFLQIQHDFETSKDISEPENDLFNKLFYLSSKVPDDFLFSVGGDPSVSQNCESLLTIQIRYDKEYHYPMFPTSDSYSAVDMLLDHLIYRADNNQDIERYLILYNIKEYCKHVPLGLNFLNTVMQKMKNLGKAKEDERSEPWTK